MGTGKSLSVCQPNACNLLSQVGEVQIHDRNAEQSQAKSQHRDTEVSHSRGQLAVLQKPDRRASEGKSAAGREAEGA